MKSTGAGAPLGSRHQRWRQAARCRIRRREGEVSTLSLRGEDGTREVVPSRVLGGQSSRVTRSRALSNPPRSDTARGRRSRDRFAPPRGVTHAVGAFLIAAAQKRYGNRGAVGRVSRAGAEQRPRLKRGRCLWREGSCVSRGWPLFEGARLGERDGVSCARAHGGVPPRPRCAQAVDLKTAAARALLACYLRRTRSQRRTRSVRSTVAVSRPGPQSIRSRLLLRALTVSRPPPAA